MPLMPLDLLRSHVYHVGTARRLADPITLMAELLRTYTYTYAGCDVLPRPCFLIIASICDSTEVSHAQLVGSNAKLLIT